MSAWPGQPFPLGAIWDGDGTNFSVFSEHAERVELCLFDDDDREQRIELTELTAFNWHCYLPGVGPGQRYAYRLRYRDGAVETVSSETWVSVPSGYVLAIEGLRPNPAPDEMIAVFALGSAQSATLEVIDLAGRRLIAREVGGLGPGRHVLRLQESRSFAPGIYWLRLSQGSESRVTKGLLAR